MAKAVLTPDERFPGARLDAARYNISHTMARRRAQKGLLGWRYAEAHTIAVDHAGLDADADPGITATQAA